MTFSKIFNTAERILSFEFFPPKKIESLDDTKALITRLSQLSPNFMTVTYGAGGGTRDLTRTLTSFIARDLGITSVAHLTCVDHSASDLDEIVDNLIESGIHHILALRGDPPRGESQFVPHSDGFSCARDLVSHLSSRTEVSLAVAGYPEPHPEARSEKADMEYLKQKVDAGAEAIITQLFFEPGLYFNFVDRCRKADISIPILPGILPIRNVSQVKKFTELCGASIPEAVLNELNKRADSPEDVISYGIDLASQICKDLIEGGAPGVHLYTLNKGKQIESVVKNISAILR